MPRASAAGARRAQPCFRDVLLFVAGAGAALVAVAALSFRSPAAAAAPRTRAAASASATGSASASAAASASASVSAAATAAPSPPAAVDAASGGARAVSLASALGHFAALCGDAEARLDFGRADAGTLAPRLAVYYKHSWQRRESSGALYDVGANLGDVSDHLIAAFAPGIRCHRFQRSVNLTGHREACAFWVWPVVAFEPNPETHAALVARAALERWDLAQFEAVQAALTSALPARAPGAAGGATARFYSAGGQGDQQGALGSAAGETQAYFEVPLTTVDAFRAGRGEADDPVFLLKVDAEGFDGNVLAGARAALRTHRVKFVVAEYNSKWRTVIDAATGEPAWSLRSIAAWMLDLGYECHLLTPDFMIPLFADYWQDAYEFWAFSNFLCAPLCDADVLHLAATYARAWTFPRPDCTQPPPPTLRRAPDAAR
jgi:FkbM family methyltransferase